ncbi:MAG: hypothetical protein AUJ85_09680 [Elusimicrobia bacterium CG1_02_37_114]|nr:MAG: hypothetical protein AUJ85_09680 [Elusimicrobia bacterium CG1_02_37_114]PIV53014.1 MAG: hypothetical protein COS17_06115 [Elusimicrobia bacterium CG02_land_8_20_14_3_00_37_13]
MAVLSRAEICSVAYNALEKLKLKLWRNRFRVVNRYKLAERARGYLIAKGLESIEQENDVTD